jgi:hypothetical protein
MFGRKPWIWKFFAAPEDAFPKKTVHPPTV